MLYERLPDELHLLAVVEQLPLHRRAEPPRQEIECLCLVFHGAFAELRDALRQPVDGAQPVFAIGHHELGGAGRGRCAHIGHEIRNREVDLVAHGADDRDRAVGNPARQFFVIECPQVFEGPATAADDQHVALVATNRGVQCLDQLARREVALH